MTCRLILSVCYFQRIYILTIVAWNGVGMSQYSYCASVFKVSYDSSTFQITCKIYRTISAYVKHAVTYYKCVVMKFSLHNCVYSFMFILNVCLSTCTICCTVNSRPLVYKTSEPQVIFSSNR